MENHPGVFIVLEGSDGSGKGTQLKLLAARLDAAGYGVQTFDFPRYDQASSHFVKKYLAGEYGPAEGVNPYTASIFYALDRYEASFAIRQALSEGKVVLSNRYVGSNMAHQGSKFSSEGEQRGFFMWEDSLEFQLLGIPRPNANIFLHLEAEISQQLIIKRAAQQGIELDEHERNLNHLQKSVAAYELLCKLFPKDFTMIECAANGDLQSIPEISDKVWQSISPLLKGLPKYSAHARTVRLDNPPGQANQLPPTNTQSTAAGNSQSLKGITYLTARSLMAIPGINIKENNPLLPAPGAASQIYKDYKAACTELANTTKRFTKLFKKALSNQSDLSDKRVENILNQVEKGLMPLFYRSNYILDGTEIALHSAKTELENVSKKSGAKRLQALAGTVLEKVAPPPASPDSGVKMVSCLPRNELDLLPKLLYKHADITESALSESLDGSSYDEKSRWLKDLLDSGDPTLQDSLEKEVSYRLEVIAGGLEMETMLTKLQPRNIKIQPVSPLSGYSIPAEVEETGLAEDYSECFDKSLELFSRMQADGRHEGAQYACLRAHKVRFEIELGPRGIRLLAGSEESNFKKEALEAVSVVHPLTFAYMHKSTTPSASQSLAPRQKKAKRSKRRKKR